MRSRSIRIFLLTTLLLSLTLVGLPETARAATGSVVPAQAWTYVAKGLPDQGFWNTTPYLLTGHTPDGLTRAFYQFDLSGIRDRVRTGWFRNVLLGVGGCPADVELWETGNITPKTTWRNQPQWKKKIATLQFTDNCGEQIAEWSMTRFLDQKKITVGLRLADEKATGTIAVIRAGTGAIQVNNTKPDKPVRLWLPWHDQCGFTHGVPEKLPATNVLTPTFNALLTDRDNGQALRAHFEWRTADGVPIAAEKSAFRPADRPQCVTVPAEQLVESGKYQWRVRTDDGTTLSPWSDWYDFTIDMTAPDKAPIVSSADYPEGQVAGRIEQPGTFVIDPNGVPDIFFYCCDGDHSITTETAVLIKPLTAGPQTRQFTAYDGAGNPSPDTVYSYTVNEVPLPTISSDAYPESQYGGGVGVPGEFTFTGNGLADLIAEYAYRLVPPDGHYEEWVRVPAQDGTTTVKITPAAPDHHVLLVEALDRDGDTLWSESYLFSVNP
ncbi:hypothetical protein Aph01nite_18990 [Acrocarpospora phusangensis]|uniref:Uncharacterized protein n=1 Tax=Acrocarpospora phusangensis TaxID=1070424 RepID=A0A919Q9C8_9ACTN|nr:hypothetical protein [Acrocarpospora phusangensis]GIH23589.1 hypothetical protein Aph01nite_18990 [Acrocarpospora phusangensis]